MATSPSLSIGSISNAVITDQGASVSMGKISWSVAGQAEADFSATKANYYTDTSGWSSRYYWSEKSGTTNFNGLSNTVTVSTQVTVYTKSITKSSSGTFVTMYADASSAQTACDNVSGSAEYIYEYSYGNSPINGALGYCVYKYDLFPSTSSSTVTLSQNVDVSNYITIQVTKPSPTYSLSYGITSATASISNLSSGDSVVFTIYTSASGSYVTSSSGTASGSSMTLSVSGLSASTSYSALVTVNGSSLGYKSFTTNAAPQPTYTISSVTHSSAVVTVSNLMSGDTVVFEVSEGASGANFKTTSGTASGSSITLSISGLTPGVQHSARVLVNGTSLGYKNFTTDTISQTCSTSYGEKSITVTVSNLSVGDTATFFLRKSTESTAPERSYTRSTSSDSSSNTWTVEVEYDVEYLYSIRIIESDGTVIWLVSGETFIIAAPPSTYTLSCGTDSITATIEGATANSTARLDIVSTVNGIIVGSSSGTVDASGGATLTVSGLDVGVEYIVRVYVKDTLSDGKTTCITLFDWWKSNVQRYVKMPSWQNPVNSNTYPAPVTAMEWNRLVGLVNKKCSTSIATVSAGEDMMAGSGGNVRQVADILGVSVNSGDVVMAQFFLDLRDAINSML